MTNKRPAQGAVPAVTGDSARQYSRLCAMELHRQPSPPVLVSMERRAVASSAG